MIDLINGRVKIRDFKIEDIENKVLWINNPNNNTFLHYDIPLTVEKTKVWFENKAENRLDCVMEYDNVSVGLIGLLNIDNVSKKAEFYISMGDEAFKRKGISYTATKMLLDYAFKNIGLKKVYLNVDEENVPACNLYEKLGFKKEGLFIRDLFFKERFVNRVRYAILEEEYDEHFDFKCRDKK